MGEMAVYVKLDFGDEPCAALLAEECGDEAQGRGFAERKSGDSVAAFEFLIDALDDAAGADAPVVGEGIDSILQTRCATGARPAHGAASTTGGWPP
jgi:hypothetical protein